MHRRHRQFKVHLFSRHFLRSRLEIPYFSLWNRPIGINHLLVLWFMVFWHTAFLGWNKPIAIFCVRICILQLMQWFTDISVSNETVFFLHLVSPFKNVNCKSSHHEGENTFVAQFNTFFFFQLSYFSVVWIVSLFVYFLCLLFVNVWKFQVNSTPMLC